MKSLVVFTGCMGAAKSTGALHAARRHQRLGKKVQLIRPRKSLRSHETPGILITKNGENFPATEVNSAKEINNVIDSQVVWIDEPFLFEDEELLFDVVKELRKTREIIASGIGNDVLLEPFKTSMPKLLAAADDIIFCKADCDACLRMGSGTRTLLCADIVREGQVFVGSQEFSAVCVECYNSLMQLPANERKNHIKSKPSTCLPS